MFKRTGVAVMIGEADVWGTDGPPYELPQWLAQAVPGYPLPLTVEVWGGYTLDQNENGTLRKVLATDGMEAVVGGPYYLDQDLPRPFRPPTSAAAKREVFTAPYWVSWVQQRFLASHLTTRRSTVATWLTVATSLTAGRCCRQCLAHHVQLRSGR